MTPHLLTGAAAIVVVAVAAQALPAGERPAQPAPPRPAPAAGEPAAPAPSAAVARRFGVLRRERTHADRLSAAGGGISASDYHAAQTRRLRPVPPNAGGAPPASDAFVAPAPGDRICLLVLPPGFDGPGGTCAARREALSGGLVFAAAPGAGLTEVVGLVPDGVTVVTLALADRRRLRLPVRDNAYGALVRGRVREARYREPQGRLRRVPL